MTITLDRAAAVREALRRLVAERGFHGASMSAVAREAGVAVGTAYVHYESKDELVLAAYLEAKADLGAAVGARLDAAASARERFGQAWLATYEHLLDQPTRARFLVQVDASPYAAAAHERAMAVADDPLVALAAEPDLRSLLAPLSALVLYDLGLGPAVRAVAAGTGLAGDRELAVLVEACWRAITVDH
jgi:AcrR family transcriptional regulator